MYRLLIVEDEPWTRRGLENIIPWTELNIIHAGSSSNGASALEKLDDFQPDIIITDIKMPKMDGLTLIDKIKRKDSSIKIIIISGYNDFDYARKAIKFGVHDYLLKPIDPEELTETLRKVTDVIKQNGINKWLKNQIKFKNFLYEILSEPHSGYQFEEELPDAYYCILQTIYPIDKSLTELLKDEGSFISLSIGIYHLYFIYFAKHEEVENFLLKQKHHQESTEMLYQGVSRVHSFAENSFLTAYNESKNDLRNNGFLRTNEHAGTILNYSFAEEERILLPLLRSGNKGKLIPAVTSIADRFHSFAQQWIFHFHLYLFFGRYIKSLSNDSLDPLLWLHELKSIKTIEGLKVWREQMIEPVLNEVDKVSTGKSAYIDSAKSYIESHYHQPSLSLEGVADYLKLSPPYLSYLFKNETGINFTKYVNLARIQSAKKLLHNPKNTVQQVSQQVGFNDVKYFNSVFKRITGITPSMYRESSPSPSL